VASDVRLVTEVVSLIAGLIQLIVVVWTLLKVQTIYHATNSMKDELVAEVRKASHAEGRQEQRDINGAGPS